MGNTTGEVKCVFCKKSVSLAERKDGFCSDFCKDTFETGMRFNYLKDVQEKFNEVFEQMLRNIEEAQMKKAYLEQKDKNANTRNS